MSEPVFNAAKASVIQACETYDEKDQTEHTLNEIIDRFINNMPEYSNIDKGALSFRIQSEISLS